jgi:ubiquinone/menaquinone biosynthesis C-methylase UbiE
MNVQQAYNSWALSYDTVPNKTRDLEARAIRALVPKGKYPVGIELGCGTGKNTEWLATTCGQLTAVDFAADMMQQAQRRLPQPHIRFVQADITQPWQFADGGTADLITCSLVLEHVEQLEHVFAQTQQVLRPGGLFYLGELHPFRQYRGSQARFETPAGDTLRIEAYVHHLSDYTEAAYRQGLRCLRVQEWFDENDRASLPRLLTLLLEKRQ